MVRDTVGFLRARGAGCSSTPSTSSTAILADRAYALEVLRAAGEAGAEVVALCDTNGGMLPPQIGDVVADAVDATGVRLGIHCHNDTGCAVANTLAAVAAGATHVQGTINGYGERTGNADLLTVVSNLQLKQGRQVLPDGRLEEATRIAHAVSEMTNVPPYSRQPYVGASAFAHKAGLHASAIRIDPDLYQHTDPMRVGNDMRMLVSDMAGRASIELKARELGYDLAGQDDLLVAGRHPGQGAGAAGLHLRRRGRVVRAAAARRGRRAPGSSYFEVESWRVITDSSGAGEALSEATVKLVAAGRRVVATGEGNGPVNALDHALRQALTPAYPEIDKLELIDFRVRILDAAHGTDAVTRVLIETSDGTTSWETVGVAPNIVEASWLALVDGITYGLLRQGVSVR